MTSFFGSRHPSTSAQSQQKARCMAQKFQRMQVECSDDFESREFDVDEDLMDFNNMFNYT